MLYADAVRLEKILSAFKKAHPDKAVTVLFGHLHAALSWEVDGVRYIINGDGALKRYVRPEWGGMLAYTKLTIDENRIDFKFVPLVKKISIVDEAIQSGALKLPVGAERNLQLYGDFSLLTANYILPLNKTVPINPFADHIEMTWTSSDPDVIAVDERGRITAKRQGSATLTVAVGGATQSLTVTAVDPKVIRPLKLILDPAEAVTEGEPITFQVTAFDAYSNAFALDNKEVAWSVKDDIGSVQDGVFTPGITDEDRVGHVVALFNQKRAEAKVTVKATSRLMSLIVVPDEAHLPKGERLPLTVRLLDPYGREVLLSGSALHFESSDVRIAAVDDHGVITAVGAGQATVQVMYEGLEAIVNVTVTEAEPSPFHVISSRLERKDGIQATVTIQPAASFASSAVVVFQLTKRVGDMVELAGIVATEKKSWSDTPETFTGYFNVIGSDYQVNVFVLDEFSSAPERSPRSLMTPIELK
ncbi:MAG: Bacterial immunogloblin [Hydrogenibacillus schlegelii]|uniref:Bacterial immunogloblin n=1 Tax=Hydrogenibacillus schlegelii TaxID=1484 RepID=A0A2T5G3T1_HYDSH|nr:Ig-like domain-containing protein [Hydrogenibacillus schlegelii]PTQ50812.1 MAG: Bacterial immunogloblin [Hydrogenibacillus schlegelii]